MLRASCQDEISIDLHQILVTRFGLIDWIICKTLQQERRSDGLGGRDRRWMQRENKELKTEIKWGWRQRDERTQDKRYTEVLTFISICLMITIACTFYFVFIFYIAYSRRIFTTFVFEYCHYLVTRSDFWFFLYSPNQILGFWISSILYTEMYTIYNDLYKEILLLCIFITLNTKILLYCMYLLH